MKNPTDLLHKNLMKPLSFLLHHIPPAQPPNKEMFQTVFKGSFSLCQLLLPQPGKGGGSILCNPQMGGP